MISKEELKKEIDKLPDQQLDHMYDLLKKLVLKEKAAQQLWTRDFNGKLDHADIRKAAYE